MDAQEAATLNAESLAKAYYSKGIWVLRERIKDLAAEQTRAKKCLRVIRKLTKSEVEKLAALKAGGYEGDDYPKHWECVQRRMKITAYLVVYAHVRHQICTNRPGKDYYDYTYQKLLQEAQGVFDEAAKIPTTA